MKFLGTVTLLALVLLMFFAVSNWAVLTAPTSLNFLAFTVQGPLGLILLGATLFFLVLFAIYALSLRTSALLDERHHTKELQAQRQLADNAETSRYTALAAQFEDETARTRTLLQDLRTELLSRLDRLEQAQIKVVSETANEIFAHIGQVDDKLNRFSPLVP